MKVKRYKPEINLPIAALIDIVFLLLIYFLLTTNFIKTQLMEIKLPQSSTSKQNTQEKAFIVSINKNGNIYFDSKKVSLQKLKVLLKEKIDKNPQTVVIIKSDKNTRVQNVIDVIDTVKQTGIKRVFFATVKRYK